MTIEMMKARVKNMERMCEEMQRETSELRERLSAAKRLALDATNGKIKGKDALLRIAYI